MTGVVSCVAEHWNVYSACSGVVGNGVTDDWNALQAAVDNFDTVVLPKGFYRLSRPLVLRREGVSLVGVGKTISFLMPLSDPVRFRPPAWLLPSGLMRPSDLRCI